MKYFGTDGIRGENSLFTEEFVRKVGRAVACFLKDEKSPSVAIARDTRVSGELIEQTLSAEMSRLGVKVYVEGVLPTPALCMLTKKRGCNLGVMISASHNPANFNGIKIFDAAGAKFLESNEELIEKYVDEPVELKRGVAEVVFDKAGKKDYLAFLMNVATPDLKGKKIAIDGANGAASEVAVELFRALGAEVFPYFCEADGRRINEGCGATKPAALSALVAECGADIGFSFDGDADRLIVIAENGRVVNGDHLMYVHAVDMKKRGKLHNDTVVGTVMSNLGFQTALNEKGIKLVRTAVGDKYVYERMQKEGHNIGGEQSGHIIFSDFHTTGDGLISALLTSALIVDSAMSRLVSEVKDFPQTLVNLKLTAEQKEEYKKSVRATELVRAAEARLGIGGRVLVRLSGTEPLLRVMVEARTQKEADETATNLGNDIMKELN